jgi:LacI family transcriptional regulator
MMVKKAKCAEEIIRFASMWNMDGIVVIGFCDPDYMYLRNHMRIPFAVYDGFCEKPERILNITIDNFEGGYQMGCHFRELGHQTALCISDNNICVDMERFCGFCKGFAPGKADLLLIPMQKEQRWSFYLSNLEKFQQVTAVFAVSDYYAIDLMHFLIEQGFSVPEDISVAGFDDTPMCEMVTPTLTTIKQDGALRAKIAVGKLKELREGKEICTEVKLPVSLVVRRSTKEHK